MKIGFVDCLLVWKSCSEEQPDLSQLALTYSEQCGKGKKKEREREREIKREEGRKEQEEEEGEREARKREIERGGELLRPCCCL